MTINEFVSKAIEGGWKNNRGVVFLNEVPQEYHWIMLDPEAWKAVGKVEGWDDEDEEVYIYLPQMQEERRVKLVDIEDNIGVILRREGEGVIVAPYKKGREDGWRKQMHHMIDALCEGKTIEQYLETL